MKNKPIIIINGEPNSIFLEIFFKSLKYKKYKSPLILISSLKLIKLQMKKLKFKMNIKLIDYKNINKYKLNNNHINLINIKYNPKKAFENISNKSTYAFRVKTNAPVSLPILYIHIPISNRLIFYTFHLQSCCGSN